MESLQTPAAAEGDVVDVAPATSKNRRGRLGRRLDVGLSTLLLLGVMVALHLRRWVWDLVSGTPDLAVGRLLPPDFIILGVQKAGTTATMQNLNNHPDIFVLDEPHFFDNFFSRGKKWYFEQFKASDKPIKGEKTPELIYIDSSWPRIKDTAPNAKFVLFLRDPVQRAFSSWNMNTNNGIESLSFEAACHKNLANLHERRSNRASQFHYVQRGFYHDQIVRFLKEFSRRERLLIVISEQMRAQPERQFSRIVSFLKDGTNIPSNLTGNFQAKGFEGRYFSRALNDSSPSLLEELESLYKPHNERLFRLLDIPGIPEWR